MSNLAWELRPLEERITLNPAFLALLLRSVVLGYREESDRALPLPLVFIAMPIVLHRPTREALPTSIRTSMPVWLQEHQFLRQRFPARARDLASTLRETLLIALSSRLLSLDEGELDLAQDPSKPRRSTTETRALLHRAHFIGRWLAHAGDVATIYVLWGVKP